MARECSREFPGIKSTTFTTRQSLAIASLGTTRVFRKREPLGIKDLVDLAVITSPPEAQSYAEMIALRILVGDEREIAGIAGTAGDGMALPSELRGLDVLLQDIVAMLGLDGSVDTTIDEKAFSFADRVKEEIFSKPREGAGATSLEERLDLARKRLAHDIAGGRDGIVNRGIDSWEALLEAARKELRQAIPRMAKEEMAAAALLSMTTDVAALSREDEVKTMAGLLDVAREPPAPGSRQRVSDLLDTLTQRGMSRALDTIQEYESMLDGASIPGNEFAPMIQEMREQVEERVRAAATTFDDILDHPGLFEHGLDRDRLDAAMNASAMAASSPLDLLARAKDMDDYFGTNMASRVYEEFGERFEDLSLDEIAANPVPSGEYMDLLGKAAGTGEPMPWDERAGVVDSLLDGLQQVKNNFIVKAMRGIAQAQLDAMTREASTRDELVSSVELARSRDFQVQNSDVMQKGRELGLSREEIARLIRDVFQYLKEMIATEDPSFERVDSLLRAMPQARSREMELAKLSVQHDAAGALGALATRDLGMAAGMVPDTEEGHDLLERALGAGGGENLLSEWFKHGHRLPPWLRQIAKDAAKRVMIEIARQKSSMIGSSDAGPLPEGTTRPYVQGDDPDTIDLDETLDNILDTGKRIDDVKLDDFIVRKEVTGRRCVVFLIDISGSMSGAPLASASIACAMLLMAFSRDELGVALFESNTHVICEIGEKIDLDEVVDEILELTARGGTQMQAALEWAEQQFTLSRSQDKMFVMLTDAMIGDFERCESHFLKIADQDVTSVLVVPESSTGLGNIQTIAEAANAQLTTVGDWQAFPDVVSRVLSRL